MKSARRADSVALPTLSFSKSLKQHWPEYLMEAAALGIFMICAGVFTALFECPASFAEFADKMRNFQRRLAFLRYTTACEDRYQSLPRRVPGDGYKQLALRAGTSAATIKRHYREVLTPEVGESGLRSG